MQCVKVYSLGYIIKEIKKKETQVAEAVGFEPPTYGAQV